MIDKIYPARLTSPTAGEDDGKMASILPLISLMALPTEPLDPVAAMLSICMYGTEYSK